MIITITLDKHKWSLDHQKQLGDEGGFGSVYEGNGTEGNKVAIKRLKHNVAHLAQRELKIAERFIGKNFSHIFGCSAV